MFKSINTNISIDMVIMGLSYIITCQLGDVPSIFLACDSLSKIRRRERYDNYFSEIPYRPVSGYLC